MSISVVGINYEIAKVLAGYFKQTEEFEMLSAGSDFYLVTTEDVDSDSMNAYQRGGIAVRTGFAHVAIFMENGEPRQMLYSGPIHDRVNQYFSMKMHEYAKNARS
jgi:hypothetical protein